MLRAHGRWQTPSPDQEVKHFAGVCLRLRYKRLQGIQLIPVGPKSWIRKGELLLLRLNRNQDCFKNHSYLMPYSFLKLRVTFSTTLTLSMVSPSTSSVNVRQTSWNTIIISLKRPGNQYLIEKIWRPWKTCPNQGFVFYHPIPRVGIFSKRQIPLGTRVALPALKLRPKTAKWEAVAPFSKEMFRGKLKYLEIVLDIFPKNNRNK